MFGDIVAIYEGSTKVAEYAYDAYGNCTIVSDTGYVGRDNPFRYRGYYWDNDLQLYYLMSRYYDPQTGRFINADSPEYLDPETIGGLNLYAYCNNDPIAHCDPSGHFLISTAVAVGFWIGLTIGAIAGATAGGIIAYNIAKDSGAEGWELFGWTLAGIVGGGLAGGIVGGVIGAAIGYGVGLIWGSAPVAGSNGAVALWSGGKGVAAEATKFAGKTGAKLVSKTFAGKTLSFAQHLMPKAVSKYLWGQLSAEFVAGAASATIFLDGVGISATSVFYSYELWVLLEKGIERLIYFI